MKKTTFILTAALIVLFGGTLRAQETCTADGTKPYFTTNAGWTASEWYKIIDIDAANLGSSGMVKHTGANGTATSTAWNSGTFTTPILRTIDTNGNTEPTDVLWPVNYYLSCINDTAHNSSWSKVNITGANVSGKGDVCYANDNTVKTSPIWDKKGFIELSRQAADALVPTVSRHGYIVLADLPQVERVQWSYSSTGWKRGIKCDIKHGDGPWEPLRWEPSDIASSLAGFSEQGYAFEEIIGKQEDPTSKISLRWRIWDGDSIHQNLTKTDGTTYSTTNTPLAQKQVVRIHQIKVFGGVVPTQGPSAVQAVSGNNIRIYVSGKNIVLSEEANVELYTIDGKKMYNGLTKLIDATGFSKGIYIIKAVDSNGKIQNKKISI